MKLKTTVNREYHSNGQLAYTETIAKIPNSMSDKYQVGTLCANGDHYIRVGECAKYHSNGQLAWLLVYNNEGDIIPQLTEKYHRDGTVVTY